MKKSIKERLLNLSVDSGKCRLWVGATSGDGYGKVKVNGKTLYSHRVAYAEYKEDIPSDLQIDHTCNNTRCINPEHLEPVTAKENRQRGKLSYRGRTECKYGHDITKTENILVRSDGTKKCRRCHYKRTAAWVKKDRAEKMG